MQKNNLTAGKLVRVVSLGAFLALGSTLSAEIVPSWTSNFEQYSNNEILANKASYNISTKKWRLHDGNLATVPNGNQAVAKTAGEVSFAQVTAIGNSNSKNARVLSRNFTTISLSTTEQSVLGGDIRYQGAESGSAGNSGALLMFSGNILGGGTFQISTGFSYADGAINFFAKFNNLTDPAQTESFSSAVLPPAISVIDPNAWYSFEISITPDSGVANLQVLAGNDIVWTITSSGNFIPASITAVEMQVVRPGASGARSADFANIFVGTQQIPEPTTTAALLLMAVAGVAVVAKRRRK